MEKVRPWCGQPSDRGRLKNRNNSIAEHLRNDDLLYYTFITQSAGERIFKIGEHLARYRQNGDYFLRPIRIAFCPQRCWSRRISWITCVLQTETVTNRCYINRQINVSLLSTNIKLPGITFAKFALLSSDDVASAIAWLPDKSSAADPISVLVLKGVSDVLRPFLAHLFSQTLATCCVPASFKNSFVTPILKKSGLDEATPLSYRPISNLSVISRMLERVVACQFVTYLDANHLLPSTQSGFRRGYSTETAII